MTLQDKFDIYEESLHTPPRKFLNGLIRDERVNADRALISQIKQILSQIRKFVKYQMISYAKGLMPFGRVKEGAVDPDGKKLTKEQIDKINEGVEPGFYDYTKTKEFRDDMALLFDGMGINKFIRSPEIKQKFEILKEAQIVPEDLDVDEERGYFIYNENGKKRSLTVISEKEMTALKEHAEGIPEVPAHETLVISKAEKGGETYYITDPDNAEFQAYISHANLAHKEERWEAPDIDFSKAEAKPAETVPDQKPETEKAYIGRPEKVDCRKMDLTQKREVTKDLIDRMKDPSVRDRLRVEGSYMDSLLIKDKGGNPLTVKFGAKQEEHYVVRLPGKDSATVLVQKRQMHRRGGERSWAFTVPARWQYFKCDDKGNLLKDDNGKTMKISGEKIIAEHLTPNAYVIDPPREEVKKEPEKQSINNDNMQKMFLHGFKVLYNDTHAMICGFDPEKADDESFVMKETPVEGQPDKTELTATGILKLPETIPGTEIRFDAIYPKSFTGQTCFSGVSIPEGYKHIGERAFENTAIDSLLLPESIKTIGKGICEGCYALTYARLPDTIQVIPDEAFLNSSLEKIDTSHIAVVGDRAFSGAMVTELDLSSVRELGHEALGSCPELEHVTLDASRFDEKGTGFSPDYAKGSPKIAVAWQNLSPEQEMRMNNLKVIGRNELEKEKPVHEMQGANREVIERDEQTPAQEHDNSPEIGFDL